MFLEPCYYRYKNNFCAKRFLFKNGGETTSQGSGVAPEQEQTIPESDPLQRSPQELHARLEELTEKIFSHDPEVINAFEVFLQERKLFPSGASRYLNREDVKAVMALDDQESKDIKAGLDKDLEDYLVFVLASGKAFRNPKDAKALEHLMDEFEEVKAQKFFAIIELGVDALTLLEALLRTTNQHGEILNPDWYQQLWSAKLNRLTVNDILNPHRETYTSREYKSMIYFLDDKKIGWTYDHIESALKSIEKDKGITSRSELIQMLQQVLSTFPPPPYEQGEAEHNNIRIDQAYKLSTWKRFKDSSPEDKSKLIMILLSGDRGSFRSAESLLLIEQTFGIDITCLSKDEVSYYFAIADHEFVKGMCKLSEQSSSEFLKQMLQKLQSDRNAPQLGSPMDYSQLYKLNISIEYIVLESIFTEPQPDGFMSCFHEVYEEVCGYDSLQFELTRQLVLDLRLLQKEFNERWVNFDDTAGFLLKSERYRREVLNPLRERHGIPIPPSDQKLKATEDWLHLIGSSSTEDSKIIRIIHTCIAKYPGMTVAKITALTGRGFALEELMKAVYNSRDMEGTLNPQWFEKFLEKGAKAEWVTSDVIGDVTRDRYLSEKYISLLRALDNFGLLKKWGSSFDGKIALAQKKINSSEPVSNEVMYERVTNFLLVYGQSEIQEDSYLRDGYFIFELAANSDYFDAVLSKNSPEICKNIFALYSSEKLSIHSLANAVTTFGFGLEYLDPQVLRLSENIHEGGTLSRAVVYAVLNKKEVAEAFEKACLKNHIPWSKGSEYDSLCSLSVLLLDPTQDGKKAYDRFQLSKTKPSLTTYSAQNYVLLESLWGHPKLPSSLTPPTEDFLSTALKIKSSKEYKQIANTNSNEQNLWTLMFACSPLATWFPDKEVTQQDLVENHLSFISHPSVSIALRVMELRPEIGVGDPDWYIRVATNLWIDNVDISKLDHDSAKVLIIKELNNVKEIQRRMGKLHVFKDREVILISHNEKYGERIKDVSPKLTGKDRFRGNAFERSMKGAGLFNSQIASQFANLHAPPDRDLSGKIIRPDMIQEKKEGSDEKKKDTLDEFGQTPTQREFRDSVSNRIVNAKEGALVLFKVHGSETGLFYSNRESYNTSAYDMAETLLERAQFRTHNKFTQPDLILFDSCHSTDFILNVYGLLRSRLSSYPNLEANFILMASTERGHFGYTGSGIPVRDVGSDTLSIARRDELNDLTIQDMINNQKRVAHGNFTMFWAKKYPGKSELNFDQFAKNDGDEIENASTAA